MPYPGDRGVTGRAEMEDGNGGWLTYQEAGDRLGVSAEAARAKAARKRWRRQIGNDGLARVWLPGDLPVTARARRSGDQPVTPRSPPGQRPVDAANIKVLEARVEALQAELAGARGELVGMREALTEARARADAADARSAELSADLAAERARTEKAIAALSDLAERLDALAAERARPWWRRLAG
jgi:hypothetical protein